MVIRLVAVELVLQKGEEKVEKERTGVPPCWRERERERPGRKRFREERERGKKERDGRGEGRGV